MARNTNKVTTMPKKDPEKKERAKTETDPEQCAGHPKPHQVAEDPERMKFARVEA